MDFNWNFSTNLKVIKPINLKKIEDQWLVTTQNFFFKYMHLDLKWFCCFFLWYVAVFSLFWTLLMMTFISWAFVLYILEIKSKKNAALNKPNTVSSVHENNYGKWSPSYATDGIIQRGGSTFFHSSFETSPWIRIDLQEVSTMFFLRVYMRDGAGIQLFINTFIKQSIRILFIYGSNILVS